MTVYDFYVNRPRHTTPLRPQRRRRSGIARLPFAVIAAIYLVCAVALAGVTATVLHRRQAAAPLIPAVGTGETTPRYLVLMVLDGARPDYLNITSLPHVQALERAGVRYTNAMDGILEAETPAGHATIATGSRPDKDGILGFDWANDNDRYSLFNPAKMPDLEKIIGQSGVPTLASLYKAKYPAARVVALSGHKYYAAAPLGGPDADAIMFYEGDPKGRYVPVAVPGHVPPAGVLNSSLIYPTIHLQPGQEDDLATKLALSSVSVMHPRMLLINYPEFDWPLGHVDGGNLDPSMVKTDMVGFDRDLGQIEDAYQKAGILNRTLFVITADHGMMPIKRFVPQTTIENAVTAAGTTAPDISTNSADYVWLADSSRAQTVAQNIIDAQDPGIASAYYLTTVNGSPAYQSISPVPAATERANQYLLDALLNGHEPQVVVFGTEYTSFSPTTSNWKADHGGNSWQSQNMPLVMAGPGIRHAIISTPAQLEDVAPTVLTDMGVQPRGMQGTVLADGLINPPPAAQQSRKSEETWLTPIADAIKAQEPAQ